MSKTKIIISETQAPPVGGMGGSIHSWERGKDPWHKDAFPTEFNSLGTTGERQAGWFALDYSDNIIGWCVDGTEIEIKN